MPAASCPPRSIPFLAAVAALLSGCAQPVAPLRDYGPEPGPYAARLLVRGSLQPKDTFAIYLFDGAQQCVDPRRLAVGSAESPPPSTLLRAERLSTVNTLIHTADRKTTCRSVLSFVPRTGRTYVLRIENDASSCWAFVFDATDPDKLTREPSTRRRDGDGQFCRPLATSLSVPPDPPAPAASATAALSGARP